MVATLTKKQIQEIDKIERAIDEFARQIKRRMIKKYEVGGINGTESESAEADKGRESEKGRTSNIKRPTSNIE